MPQNKFEWGKDPIKPPLLNPPVEKIHATDDWLWIAFFVVLALSVGVTALFL